MWEEGNPHRLRDFCGPTYLRCSVIIFKESSYWMEYSPLKKMHVQARFLDSISDFIMILASVPFKYYATFVSKLI